MSTSRFIRALVAIQGETPSTAFAGRLGISKQFWSNLRNGRRPVPKALARRWIVIWPALAAEYIADAAADILPTPPEPERVA